MADVVAVWEVPMNDKVHRIEFEHGTGTGKRVVRVDDKEVVRHDWMFKLVGNEDFEIGLNTRCQIQIRAKNTFGYGYRLFVDGKAWKKFKEMQEKSTKTWIIRHQDGNKRIVLDKDSLDVWIDGAKVGTESVFTDEGTEIQLQLNDGITETHVLPTIAYIKSFSSGNRREGIVYSLILNGQEVPESFT